MSYDRLEREEQKPKRIVDRSQLWSTIPSVLDAGGQEREWLEAFAARRGFAVADLAALDARHTVRGGRLCIAYAGTNGNGAVTAIKYRPVDGGSHESTAEPSSVWLRPIVCGNRDSTDWLIVEGETDAARLHALVGESCAIMALPVGARTFKREWADVVPRGATVHLCHDADGDGDAGAAKAAKLIGGRVVRVRPPVEGGDWCDFDGGRDDFVRLVAAARVEDATLLDVVTARELCARPDPEHDGALLGPLVVAAARTIVLGHTGGGKSTLIARVTAAIVHGEPFLDWVGVGGARVLLVDLEQSEADAKRMLREAGLDRSEAVAVALVPDGLELDSNDAELALVEQAIVDGGFAVVVFDPYYKAHRAEDANAERQVVDLMRRLDGLRARHGFALLLGAHPRKPPVGNQPALTIHDLAGSGAAVRGAEIVVAIERVSDGYSRLRFLKDRAGRLPVGDAWGLLFERDSGYRRDPNDGKTRDVRAELLEALADGNWRTVTELRRKKDDGGIGADPETIRPALDALTLEGLLEHRVGPAGRQPSAKCWRVSSPSDDTDDTAVILRLPVNREGSGVVVSSPYRDDTTTPTPTPQQPVNDPGVVAADDTTDDDTPARP